MIQNAVALHMIGIFLNTIGHDISQLVNIWIEQKVYFRKEKKSREMY